MVAGQSCIAGPAVCCPSDPVKNLDSAIVSESPPDIKPFFALQGHEVHCFLDETDSYVSKPWKVKAMRGAATRARQRCSALRLLHDAPEACHGMEVVSARAGTRYNRHCAGQCVRVDASWCARWLPLRSATMLPAGVVLLQVALLKLLSTRGMARHTALCHPRNPL
jgi:hypothetical protein